MLEANRKPTNLTILPQNGINRPIVSNVCLPEQKSDFVFAIFSGFQLVVGSEPHQAVDRHAALLSLDVGFAGLLNKIISI
jgi:hypothetical protein